MRSRGDRRTGRQTLARPSGRGVSPIIAEILLVASTVVCAAVLYVLVSGYLGGGGTHAPDSIGLARALPASENCAGTPVYYENIGVTAVAGSFTTDDFGLKVAWSTNATALAPTYPAGDVNACPAAGVTSGWWALLEYPAGTVDACFGTNNSGLWTSATGGGCTNSSPTPGIQVNSGDEFAIYVVGSNPGGVYTLSAYGLNGLSLSGSVDL